jgi:S1-C subfamily serine protease
MPLPRRDTIPSVSIIHKEPFMKATLPRLLAFVALLALPAAALTTDDVKTIGASVVKIHNTAENPDYRTPWNSGRVGRGTGTGFFIGDGRLMTNAHVVSNSRFLAVTKEGDPNKYTARVKHVAHDCDLAILEVEDPKFFDSMKPLSFGGLPALHSTVNVFGYPIGGERMSVTRGVVSRIEFRPYAHSAMDSHLAVQIDAAINPGNSGGPVLQNQQVVGVAFQGISGSVAQNTGYMIPMPVVNRFLTDVKQDGKYDGYAELGINHFNLINPVYRGKLGLPPGDQGVVVTGILTNGSADGVIKSGDVLMAIDGHAINADGKINLEGEFVELEEIVERKFRGDKVALDVIRDGKPEKLTITLQGAEPYRIYVNRYDEKPRFLVFAGLVFQPVDRNFLGAHGIKDPAVLDLFTFYVDDKIFTDFKEIVVLSSILADPINTHMKQFTHNVVDTVNGNKVRTMKQLDAELAKSADRYVIRFLGDGLPLVVQAADLKAAHERIATQYQVNTFKYLGETQEVAQ